MAKVLDKPENISNLFLKAQKDFSAWLAKKPTGEFVMRIFTNQGGIRGKPKITITKDI